MLQKNKLKKKSPAIQLFVIMASRGRSGITYIHSAFSAYQRLVSLFVDRVKHERQQSPILFQQWSVLHTSTVAKKSDMVPQLDHTEDLKHTWSWLLQLGVGLWWWIVAPFKFQLPLFDAQDRTLGNLIASNISQRMKVKLVLLMLLLLLLLLCSFHPPSWLALWESATSCGAIIYVNRQLFPNQNEQDLASCNLVEVAHLQKSHMCNNTFHCGITAWRLLTAVAWRQEIPLSSFTPWVQLWQL